MCILSTLGCCFGCCPPTVNAIIGTILSVVSFGLLTWAISELGWPNDSSEALYIISYIFVIFIFLAFVALTVLCCIKSTMNYLTINSIGKTLTVAIIITGLISLIMLIISMIIMDIKFVDIEDDCDYFNVECVPDKYWIAANIPGWIVVCLLPTMMSCACSLCSNFDNAKNPVGITENPYPVVPVTNITYNPAMVQPVMMQPIMPNPYMTNPMYPTYPVQNVVPVKQY